MPMSPSCLQPRELAAQVLFAEQEIGRLQVELQVRQRRVSEGEREVQRARAECQVRSAAAHGPGLTMFRCAL